MKITTLTYDSRKAVRGSAFFAVKGLNHDGLDYALEAGKKGAAALICDRYDERAERFEEEFGGRVYLVSDVPKAMAEGASLFYRRPQDRLVIIGVTGTKGKTTTSFMIKRILESAGIKTGIIGTVVSGWDGSYTESCGTTPQSADIFKLLSDMKACGCKAAVMEVSSQALMQSRVYGLQFDIAVFTNIFPDHIGRGEHKNFEEYFYWKQKLFDQTKTAIINNDDENGRYIARHCSADRIITYGLKNNYSDEKTDFSAENIIRLRTQNGILGIQYDLGRNNVMLSIPGVFNVYNSLAAMAACTVLGIGSSEASCALHDFTVRGRTEIVPISDEFTVIVDYAHNGRALKELLVSLRDYSPARLIVVFGCGGERDKSRRSLMGKEAGRLADLCIITSDNPRHEDPDKIISDIADAVSGAGGEYVIVRERREAIVHAVSIAMRGDIIVIAGKGHETYQIIGEEKIYFDDREVILSSKMNDRG